MTNIRTGLIAALGLLVAGSMTSASAAPPALSHAGIGADGAAGLHQIGDRGNWIEPSHRWRDGGYYYHDDYSHKRYKKKKKRRKYFKRGYRRGYDSGYDKGYYDGRYDHYYSKRRRHDRHHRHGRDYMFRGGIEFGDGYFRGGRLRFGN